MRKVIFMPIILGSLLLTGCSSILMPYKSEFKCQKGAGEGVCNSVSENYETLTTKERKAPKEQTVKEVNNEHNNDSFQNFKAYFSPSKEINNEDSNDLKPQTEIKKDNCKECIDISQAVWLKQRAMEKELKGDRKW